MIFPDQRLENPCVGGSIPPRATKLQEKRQPSGWRFSFQELKSLAPIYSRQVPAPVELLADLTLSIWPTFHCLPP